MSIITQQTQTQPKISEFDKIREIAEDREIKTLRLSECPEVIYDRELLLSSNSREVPITEGGLQSFLSLIDCKVSSDFVRESLLIEEENREHLNTLIESYWRNHFRSSRTRRNGAYIRAVNDKFTTGNKFEIRFIHTNLYTPLTDLELINFIEAKINTLRFFRGYATKEITRLRFLSKDIKVGPRSFKLGLQFTNSEFGTSSIDLAMFEVDLECVNQFIPFRRRYHFRIPHKGKTTESFLVKVREGKERLFKMFNSYGDKLQKAYETPLKIECIEDILENPINNSFARIPETYKQGIVECFNRDNLSLTHYGLRSAITRYIRDNPSLMDHYDIGRAVDSLI